MTTNEITNDLETGTKDELADLGRELARRTGWSGNLLMEIFQAALTDANFHTEAEVVEGWLNAMEEEPDYDAWLTQQYHQHNEYLDQPEDERDLKEWDAEHPFIDDENDSAPLGGGSADAAIVFDDIIDSAPYRELSDYRGETVAWKRDGKAYEGTILQADPDGDVMWLYIQYATLAGLGVIVGETWLTEECVSFVNENTPAVASAFS